MTSPPEPEAAARPERLLGAVWILLFTVLGEAAAETFRLPLPGSVVGLASLFVFLRLGLVQADGLRWASGLLTRHMGLFFVPAGVLSVGPLLGLRGDAPAVVVGSVVSSLLVAWVTAKVAGRAA